jgi:hypothetical protein
LGMAGKFSLHGNMIPRTVRRMFDQRSEARHAGDRQSAVLTVRGKPQMVSLVNVSSSGAMIRYSGTVHIGESISLQMLDRGAVRGQVRWVRDGRVGVSFDVPLE